MRALRFLTVLGALLFIQGCTSWHQRPFAAGEVSGIRADRPVRVLQANGSLVALERPRVEGDSLVGEVEMTDRRYAVALSDIRRLEEKRISAGRTAGLSMGVLVGLVVVSGLLAALWVLGAWTGSHT